MNEAEPPVGALESEDTASSVEADMEFEVTADLEAEMEAEAERAAEAEEAESLEAEAAAEAQAWANAEAAHAAAGAEDAEDEVEAELAGAEDGADAGLQADAEDDVEAEAHSGVEDGLIVEIEVEAEGEDAAAPESRIALHAGADAEVEQIRMLEALLFAAAEPLDEQTLAGRLPAGADVKQLIVALQAQMQGRGVELAAVAGGWRLQTRADLAWLLEDVREERRKLSGAARETLAIIAYHQPVTRAEIEEIRGVAVSKGTVDMLMELGWVRMRGRRRAPGRPVTYGTTDLFLSHFGLDQLEDLPGKAELKAAGLLDSRLPPDFNVPTPGLIDTENEDPLEDAALENAEFHVDFMGEGEETAEVQAVPA